MDVSCVFVHSRCISSHMAGAYTHFFFRDKGGTVQPPLSRLGLSNVQGLYSPTRLENTIGYFSSAQWPKIELSVQLVGVVFCSLPCTTEASKVQGNLLLFPHWYSSICCRGEDRWWGRCCLYIFVGFRIWGCTTIHEIITEMEGSSRYFFDCLRTRCLLKTEQTSFAAWISPEVCAVQSGHSHPRWIFTLLSCRSQHNIANFHRFIQLILLKDLFTC